MLAQTPISSFGDAVPRRNPGDADGGYLRRAAPVLVRDHPAVEGLGVLRDAIRHRTLDPLVGHHFSTGSFTAAGHRRIPT
jgi:hypothetical protein